MNTVMSPEEVFDPEMWNHPVVNRIRELVYEGQPEFLPGITYQYCDDQKYATVNVSQIERPSVNSGAEEDEDLSLGLTLWLTWYKNRGRTEAMWLLDTHGLPRRPTLQELTAIVEHYEAIGRRLRAKESSVSGVR